MEVAISSGSDGINRKPVQQDFGGGYFHLDGAIYQGHAHWPGSFVLMLKCSCDGWPISFILSLSVSGVFLQTHRETWLQMHIYLELFIEFVGCCFTAFVLSWYLMVACQKLKEKLCKHETEDDLRKMKGPIRLHEGLFKRNLHSEPVPSSKIRNGFQTPWEGINCIPQKLLRYQLKHIDVIPNERLPEKRKRPVPPPLPPPPPPSPLPLRNLLR